MRSRVAQLAICVAAFLSSAAAQQFELCSTRTLEAGWFGAVRIMVADAHGPSVLVNYNKPRKIGMGVVLHASLVAWPCELRALHEPAVFEDKGQALEGVDEAFCRLGPELVVTHSRERLSALVLLEGDNLQSKTVVALPLPEPLPLPKPLITVEVMAMADADSDGVSDALVRWRVTERVSPDRPLRVYAVGVGVVSHETRRFVTVVDGGPAFARLVSPAPDVDGDGHADFMTLGGASGEGPFTECWNRQLSTYSGATGERLHATPCGVTATGSDSLLSLTVLSDHDGDGRPEVALGRGLSDFTGDLTRLDGESGQPIASLVRDGYFSQALRVVPDIDGDGLEDLLVSAPGGPSRGVGRKTQVPYGALYLVSSARLDVLQELRQTNGVPGDYFAARFDSQFHAPSRTLTVVAFATRTEEPDVRDAYHVYRMTLPAR